MIKVDTDEVNRLLDASRRAHTAYRQAANTPNQSPNYAISEQHVSTALDLRLQAHRMDPDHTAAGWSSDRVSHDRLVDFYRRYPTIP